MNARKRMAKELTERLARGDINEDDLMVLRERAFPGLQISDEDARRALIAGARREYARAGKILKDAIRRTLALTE